MDNGSGTRSTLARMAARRDSKDGYQIVSTTRATPGVTFTSPRPGSGDPKATLRSLVGRDVSDREVMVLAGALRGSAVKARGMGPTMVQLRVQGPPGRDVAGRVIPSTWRAERFILKDSKTGQTVIYNKNLSLDPRARGQGIGARALATQVQASSRLGVSRLETEAGRLDVGTAERPAMNGYYRWAQLGYDAPWSRIAPGLSAQPPASLGPLQRLSDLMASPAGAALWKVNGTTYNGTFDLAPGSRSRAMINAYLVAHREPSL
jgi:hypothetical protein